LASLLHGNLVVGVSQTAALNRGRHLCSAGRPSRWAFAHISSIYFAFPPFKYNRNILGFFDINCPFCFYVMYWKLLFYLILGSVLTSKSFLANVHVRYMLSSVRLSSVCDVRAPYSAGCNFRQCFYAVWYLGYTMTFTENFTEIVPGELVCRGVKRKRVAKYGDFRPIEGYILVMVQHNH